MNRFKKIYMDQDSLVGWIRQAIEYVSYIKLDFDYNGSGKSPVIDSLCEFQVDFINALTDYRLLLYEDIKKMFCVLDNYDDLDENVSEFITGTTYKLTDDISYKTIDASFNSLTGCGGHKIKVGTDYNDEPTYLLYSGRYSKNFDIRYDDIYEFIEQITSEFSKLGTNISFVKESIRNLYEADFIDSEAADNIKSYFDQVHNLLLTSIETIMDVFKVTVSNYYLLYYSQLNEQNIYVIKEKRIRNIPEEIDSITSEVGELLRKYNTTKSTDVGNYIVFPTLNSTTIDDCCTNLKSTVTTFADSLENLEKSFAQTCKNDVSSLLEDFRAGLKEIYLSLDLSTYESGSILKVDENLTKLFSACASFEENVNMEPYNDLLDLVSEDGDVYYMAAACEYASQQGIRGVFEAGGGVIVLVTGAITVASGGVGAIALGATTILFGGGLTAFGLADMDESNMEYMILKMPIIYVKHFSGEIEIYMILLRSLPYKQAYL